jgi:ankyrin repeat protein
VTSGPDDAELLASFRLIASGDRDEFAPQLAASPALATAAIRIAASREDAETFFLTEIRHYVYAGDTALHVAAAAYAKPIAVSLGKHGANVSARNRRGAEPLHYAADGAPGNDFWNPSAQASVIAYLIERGADPNALDNSGVAPLHRAVRTRSAAAVRALLEHGANVRAPNKRGSTPLHLAVQNTGRSDSGAEEAKDQQREIIAVLLEHGARPTDTDASGKTVEAAATSDWIRAALASS